MNNGGVQEGTSTRRRANSGLNHHSSSMPFPPSNVNAQGELESLLQEKLELHAQLFEAGQIQRKLSGSRELHSGCLQFATEVFAARFLSGDFTMLLQRGSQVLAAHGDIAGKGIAAGMWFTNLAGLLQSYGQPDSDPAKIASEVNRHLCYLRPIAPFATAFLAQIDCESGYLRYCNAGHFSPVLLRANGEIELFETGGPLLGAIETATFVSGEAVIEPGDALLAYSDGVYECRNAADEEFGLDRLIETLRRCRQASSHATLMVVLATLQDYANGGPICDDVSLTVIQRDPEDGISHIN